MVPCGQRIALGLVGTHLNTDRNGHPARSGHADHPWPVGNAVPQEVLDHVIDRCGILDGFGISDFETVVVSEDIQLELGNGLGWHRVAPCGRLRQHCRGESLHGPLEDDGRFRTMRAISCSLNTTSGGSRLSSLNPHQPVGPENLGCRPPTSPPRYRRRLHDAPTLRADRWCCRRLAGRRAQGRVARMILRSACSSTNRTRAHPLR